MPSSIVVVEDGASAALGEVVGVVPQAERESASSRSRATSAMAQRTSGKWPKLSQSIASPQGSRRKTRHGIGDALVQRALQGGVGGARWRDEVDDDEDAPRCPVLASAGHSVG